MNRINYIREVARQAEAQSNYNLYERAVNLLQLAWSLFILNCDNLSTDILKQVANDFDV